MFTLNEFYTLLVTTWLLIHPCNYFHFGMLVMPGADQFGHVASPSQCSTTTVKLPRNMLAKALKGTTASEEAPGIVVWLACSDNVVSLTGNVVVCCS